MSKNIENENVEKDVEKDVENNASQNNEKASSAKVNKLVSGMKAKFAKCKKVSVRIPKSEHNPHDVVVQINGYIFQIKRGVDVEVPTPVKALLEKGGYLG